MLVESSRFTAVDDGGCFPTGRTDRITGHYEVVFNGKEDAVRKIPDEGAPSALLDLWELEWILEDSREDGIDLRFEAETEINAFPLVSKRRFENLELGLGRNIETPVMSGNSAASRESDRSYAARP